MNLVFNEFQENLSGKVTNHFSFLSMARALIFRKKHGPSLADLSIKKQGNSTVFRRIGSDETGPDPVGPDRIRPDRIEAGMLPDGECSPLQNKVAVLARMKLNEPDGNEMEMCEQTLRRKMREKRTVGGRGANELDDAAPVVESPCYYDYLRPHSKRVVSWLSRGCRPEPNPSCHRFPRASSRSPSIHGSPVIDRTTVTVEDR